MNHIEWLAAHHKNTNYLAFLDLNVIKQQLIKENFRECERTS